MRSALSTGMTLLVILLLFLAFNLSWVNNLPEVRWDFSQQKNTRYRPQRETYSRHSNTRWTCITSIRAMIQKEATH